MACPPHPSPKLSCTLDAEAERQAICSIDPRISWGSDFGSTPVPVDKLFRYTGYRSNKIYATPHYFSKNPAGKRSSPKPIQH